MRPKKIILAHKQTISRIRLTVLLALSSLIGTPIVHAQSANIIEFYVDSLDKIKSYDVTYAFEFLDVDRSWDGKNVENLPAQLTQTNREMFASGLGWRDERYIGDKDTHTIAILDWKTFASDVEKGAILGRGLNYNTWFNPIIKGIYLKGWLDDKQTVVTLMPDSRANDGLICLKISNSDLPFRSIQIWFDSQHGYLPARFEYFQYSKSKGKDVLSETVKIESFVQLANGAWIPNQIVRLIELPSGQAGSGQRIILDSQHSTFNTTLPAGMFLATSLLEVNMKEDGGWECYYPPALLPSIKNAVTVRQAILSPPKIKTWIIAIFVVLNAAAVAFILIKSYKSRTSKMAAK